MLDINELNIPCFGGTGKIFKPAVDVLDIHWYAIKMI
jgi:hypothetical protein